MVQFTVAQFTEMVTPSNNNNNCNKNVWTCEVQQCYGIIYLFIAMLVMIVVKESVICEVK